MRTIAAIKEEARDTPLWIKLRWLGDRQRAVLDALQYGSLNRLEIASYLHRGSREFSPWWRPSKKAFRSTVRIVDSLESKGLIEAAGPSESFWRKRYKLSKDF